MVAVSYYKIETIFDYTWKQVVQAYWHRYPNPSSTHVLTEDTICRDIRDGKLYTRRLLSKTNAVPKWGERFYKNAPVKIIEDSILDPKEKTLVTFTRNIGLKKIMRVDEIVQYSEQNDGRTLAIRRAYISSQVFGFSRAIRAFGIERFKSNCQKAANGFNFVLRNMFPAKAVIIEGGSPIMKTEQHTTTTPAATVTTPKTEAITVVTRAVYEYLKCNASKLAQLFSIRN